MALARLHRDSQPASQPRRLGRHSPGRTRDRARRPPRGRPAWSPRAPLPGDTSTRLSPRETRPPARPAPATPPPCPAADEYTLSRYTRTKHHCHNTTRRHRPISCSCLLPSCHCSHAPPPRRAHYFRVTTDRARRAPPPPTPAAAPAHAVDRAHPRTRFALRTATSLPATLAARRQRQPCWTIPLTAYLRLAIQFTAGCSRPSALLPLGPAPQGLRLIMDLAPCGGVPNANALYWRSASSPFLSSPPRASGTRSQRRQPRAPRSTQRWWHQKRATCQAAKRRDTGEASSRALLPTRHRATLARKPGWVRRPLPWLRRLALTAAAGRTAAMAVTSPAVARAVAAATAAAAAVVAHAMAAATRLLPWPRPRLPQLLPWRMQQLQPRLRQQLLWRGSNGRSDGSCCGCEGSFRGACNGAAAMAHATAASATVTAAAVARAAHAAAAAVAVAAAAAARAIAAAVTATAQLPWCTHRPLPWLRQQLLWRV